MNARIYDPTIARFASPDSIVPDPSDAQSYNRYTYVDNRPLSLTDPTGHYGDGPNPCPGGGQVCSDPIPDGNLPGDYKNAGKGGEKNKLVGTFADINNWRGFQIGNTWLSQELSSYLGARNVSVGLNSNGSLALSFTCAGNAACIQAGEDFMNEGTAIFAGGEESGAADYADDNGIHPNETVVVDVRRLPYSYTGPLDPADLQAAQIWTEDHLTDGTRLHLRSVDDETGFSISRDRSSKINAKHFCVMCDDGRHEGTEYDYGQIEKNGYPGHSHTRRQGRLPGPSDTGGVNTFGRAYVLTTQGAFAVERPASEYVVRQIIGDTLDGRQIEELDRTIQKWNQPGGAGCRVMASSC